MENLRKRVNVKIVRSDEEEKILKLVAKPTFAQQVIFNEHLVGIQNHKEKVLLRQDPPPLDLSFWSFLTFLQDGIEEIERHLL